MNNSSAVLDNPGPHPLAHFVRLVGWVLATAGYMVALPSILLGAMTCAAWLLGASSGDLRDLFISFATTDATEFHQGAVVTFAIIKASMIIVFCYRVFASDISLALVARMAEKWASKTALRPSERTRKIVFGLSCVVLLGLIVQAVFLATPVKHPSLAVTPPQVRVALRLNDGTVKSGAAEVKQNEDGSFNVRFISE